MPYNVFVDPQTRQINKAAIAAGTPGIASAARWFWWIAGLSLVNTVLIHSGGNTSFVIGLGVTLVADVACREIPAIAFVVDAMAIGFFVLMGWLALRGHFWAFIVGAIAYLLDATIYLLARDMMPLAFHAFALFFIVRGAFTLRSALIAAEIAARDVPAPPTLPAA
ncbi:MAG TPA: hypothetical protein VK178_17120 [Opitutaceae bacterium]|nr:hypothetical protein [Opitutaceae bacterium]